MTCRALDRLRDIARRLRSYSQGYGVYPERRRTLDEAEAEILRLREVGQEYFDELQATRRRRDELAAEFSERQGYFDELLATARGVDRTHTYVCIVCGHQVQDPVPRGEDPKHYGSPRPDGKCPDCLSHWMVRKRPGLRCLPADAVDVARVGWDLYEPARPVWVGKVRDSRARHGIQDDGVEDIPF